MICLRQNRPWYQYLKSEIRKTAPHLKSQAFVGPNHSYPPFPWNLEVTEQCWDLLTCKGSVGSGRTPVCEQRGKVQNSHWPLSAYSKTRKKIHVYRERKKPCKKRKFYCHGAQKKLSEINRIRKTLVILEEIDHAGSSCSALSALFICDQGKPIKQKLIKLLQRVQLHHRRCPG